MRSVQSWSDGAPRGPEADGELDLRALGAALWRRKALILLPTIVVAILTLLAVNSISPRYKSEARIVVESRENVFLRPEAEKSVDRSGADQEAVATQVQIIQSRDIARQVIKELKLNERPDFDPVLNGVSPLSAVLSLIGIGQDRLRMTPEERVMENYFSRLTVSAIERSRVITIEFKSGDPELSANVVNAIVDAYLRLAQVAKQEQTRNASAYLASEIDKLQTAALEAEQKVEDFRAKSNLFVGTNATSLSNQQLGELNSQLAAARAQKADLDAKSRLIREMLKAGRSVESADIINSDILKRLVEQRVLLRAQLAEQSSTLLPRHPRIQELNAQISSLDAQMRTELQRIVVSLENDARIAAARIEATNENLDRMKQQIGSASAQDVRLRALEREAKAQRDLLESYLARYREAVARDNIDASPAEARVISRATVSNVPAFPKKLPILLIATLATAFLMSAFVLAAEILKQGAPHMLGRTSREDVLIVERASAVGPSGVSTVSGGQGAASGSVLARLWRNRKSATKPEASDSEETSAAGNVPDERLAVPMGEPTAKPVAGLAIGDIALALRELGEPGRRIAAIGAARNVGTTHAALELARALANAGGRVVLADLSLKAPNLSVLSTDPDAPGLADLVQNKASFADIVTRDKFSRVHIVGTGKVDGDMSMILTSARLAMTLDALAQAYDHLVIDAGAMPDTMLQTIAQYAPRAMLVVPDPGAESAMAERQTLMAAGFTDVVPVRGAPVNGMSASAAA